MQQQSPNIALQCMDTGIARRGASDVDQHQGVGPGIPMRLAQLAKGRELFAAAPTQAREFVDLGASEVPAEVDAVELAALANVCLTIFNLDEALTRE